MLKTATRVLRFGDQVSGYLLSMAEGGGGIRNRIYNFYTEFYINIYNILYFSPIE